MDGSLNQVTLAWDGCPLPRSASATFALAGVEATVDTDDALLLEEIGVTLGSRAASPTNAAYASLTATVRTQGGPTGYGYLRLAATDERHLTPDDLLLGLASPEYPFALAESPDPGWTSLAFRGEAEPLFILRGGRCVFRQAPTWRAAVALLLFHRLLRLRSDAIFFHASSVGLGGKGVLFVGPKGAGKSTTALTLAARGHEFLGDETAAYLPATGEIIPVRRPVGIKPGPRARAVDQGLARAGRSPERGIVRIAVEELLPVREARPLPLRAIVLLDGFESEPRIARVDAGRQELALLQPVVGSLVNAPRTQRVFEMARMLATACIFRLSPGAPDETAALVETTLEET